MDNTLTVAQRAAVTSSAPYNLILAGPGSGKTKTIVERIAYLIGEGVDPQAITVVTFTNNAARELVLRLREVLTDQIGHVRLLGYCGTIHGLCLRMLERWGAALGYRSNIAVISEEQSREMLQEVANLIGHSRLSILQIVACRDLIGSDALRMRRGNLPEKLVVASYYKRLKDNNAIDFRGLLSEAAELLSLPSCPVIGGGYLFVDEFQDVSHQDWEVLSGLEANDAFLVGDSDQAIFAFRGGDVSVMNGMAQHTELFTLEENFRCDKAICETAQRLIEHNTHRLHKVTRPAGNGLGHVSYMPPAVSDSGEAALVITEVMKLMSDGKAKAEEIAILARTHSVVDGVRLYADAYGMPLEPQRKRYAIAGWPIAEAAVAFLATPYNNLAAARFISVRDGVDAARRARADATRDNLTIFEGMYFAGARDTIAGCTLDYLPEFLLQVSCHPDAIAALADLIKTLPDGAHMADLALAMRAVTDITPTGGGVAVTTMHAAKGREWPIVFLVGMEQEVIPGAPDRNDLAEERRLLYVAITRAKHALFVSHARQRRAPFGKREMRTTTPSQFIKEMQG